MTVSILEAFKNVIKDKDFMPNYTALVVMSFCCGLVYFALPSRNMNILIPVIILAIAAGIYTEGYHLHYLGALIRNNESKMPEWKNCWPYYLTGLKYVIAIIIFTLALCAISLLFLGISFAMIPISKVLGALLLMIFFIICFILEVFIFLCIPSFPCTFIDSEENILSILMLSVIVFNS